MPTPLPAHLRYSSVAIVLHWLIALLVAANIAIVVIADALPENEHHVWIRTHKAIGVSVLLLSLVRLGWRLTHRWPPLPGTVARWEAALARLTHLLFYVLIIAIPFTGWLFTSIGSGGKPVDMFGLFDFAGLPLGPDKPAAASIKEVHELLALSAVALVVLHVAGALKHAFADGFFRMWPSRASSE